MKRPPRPSNQPTHRPANPPGPRLAREPRACAAQILQLVLSNGESLSQLNHWLSHYPATDRPLVQELCYGICRWYWQLQGLLKILLQKPLKNKDLDIQLLLMLGLYQLLHTEIPSHAALNETVAAANRFKKPWARGLINGLLRNVLRQPKDQLMAQLGGDDEILAHPSWLLTELQLAWPEHWRRVAEQNNLRPPMCLRVNRLRIQRPDYLKQLAAAGIAAQPSPVAREGIYLSEPVGVEQLPGFAEGLVSVQDEAAQLSAHLLDLKPGQRVLDACAAPGGKSCHIKELEPECELLAVDVDSRRLAKVADNSQRLGLDIALRQVDSSAPEAWQGDTGFDRILVDAPCSATGVIRRHPDIKLLRKAEDIDKLAKQQRQLLQALWPKLNPGGILLYATCSLLPKENQDLIQAFVQQQADASLLTLNHFLKPIPGDDAEPVTNHWLVKSDTVQLLPYQSGWDGFFYAKLIKTAHA